jgi:hypothetical protein
MNSNHFASMRGAAPVTADRAALYSDARRMEPVRACACAEAKTAV